MTSNAPSGRRERVLHGLERVQALDPISDRLAAALRHVVRPGVVEDALSGTHIGHPVHPALVSVPIGAWSTGLLLDLSGGDADAARRCVGFGTLAALPTALTGASDWLSTAGAERRVGIVHALANYVAIGLQAASWTARRGGQRRRATALSVAALGMAGAGGWLGGHLAYALGVGVDTTAFQKLPTEWTDAAAVDDVPADGLAAVDVAGIPVLLAYDAGRIVALADRCTHRGAALSEGELRDGCVVCPWHDSVFRLADGAVVSGPATRPQPLFDVQVQAGRVLVRRDEPRTLRTNPTGH